MCYWPMTCSLIRIFHFLGWLLGRGGSGDMMAEFRECIHNLGELVEQEVLQGRGEDSRRLESQSRKCYRIKEDKIGSCRMKAGHGLTPLCPTQDSIFQCPNCSCIWFAWKSLSPSSQAEILPFLAGPAQMSSKSTSLLQLEGPLPVANKSLNTKSGPPSRR